MDTVDGLPNRGIALDEKELTEILGPDALGLLLRRLPVRLYRNGRANPSCGEEETQGGGEEEGGEEEGGEEEGGDGGEEGEVKEASGAGEVDPPPPPLLSAAVRRYSPDASAHDQPWTSFHFDAAGTTVNVALSPRGSHEGGDLVVVFDGSVHAIGRGEGEATAHSSSLLHGVTRITKGVRYSLILFFGHR